MELVSKCHDSMFFLPDIEEVRMDIKKACENEADEAKDLLPRYLKVLGYIYPAPH